MEQMTAAYNNEPLCSLSWQTRLIRVRTWNNVFLKPESILCKVSGAKSSYVLCSEMWTHLLLTAFATHPVLQNKLYKGDLLTTGEILLISQGRGKMPQYQNEPNSGWEQVHSVPFTSVELHSVTLSEVGLICSYKLHWVFQILFFFFVKSAEGKTLT